MSTTPPTDSTTCMTHGDVRQHAVATCLECAYLLLLSEKQAAMRVRPLDATIGRLDRLLSEFLVLAESELDEADRQTLKHHADDLIGVGNAALKKLGFA